MGTFIVFNGIESMPFFRLIEPQQNSHPSKLRQNFNFQCASLHWVANGCPYFDCTNYAHHHQSDWCKNTLACSQSVSNFAPGQKNSAESLHNFYKAHLQIQLQIQIQIQLQIQIQIQLQIQIQMQSPCTTFTNPTFGCKKAPSSPHYWVVCNADSA